MNNLTPESAAVRLLAAYYSDDPASIGDALFQATTMHDAFQRATRLATEHERIVASAEKAARVGALKEAQKTVQSCFVSGLSSTYENVLKDAGVGAAFNKITALITATESQPAGEGG